MLADAGWHPAESRLCASQAVVHNKPVTGQDIAFARGASYAGDSTSKDFLTKAKEAYAKEGIIGPDDRRFQMLWFTR